MNLLTWLINVMMVLLYVTLYATPEVSGSPYASVEENSLVDTDDARGVGRFRIKRPKLPTAIKQPTQSYNPSSRRGNQNSRLSKGYGPNDNPSSNGVPKPTKSKGKTHHEYDQPELPELPEFPEINVAVPQEAEDSDSQ